jgi:hypothetical protein
MVIPLNKGYIYAESPLMEPSPQRELQQQAAVMRHYSEESQALPKAKNPEASYFDQQGGSTDPRRFRALLQGKSELAIG